MGVSLINKPVNASDNISNLTNSGYISLGDSLTTISKTYTVVNGGSREILWSFCYSTTYYSGGFSARGSLYIDGVEVDYVTDNVNSSGSWQFARAFHKKSTFSFSPGAHTIEVRVKNESPSPGPIFAGATTEIYNTSSRSYVFNENSLLIMKLEGETIS